MSLTLDQLNAATPGDALAMLDGTYEHSPWIAERALAARPFRSLAQLKHALVQAVAAASADEKLGLIRAHPELAGKAMVSKTLTAKNWNVRYCRKLGRASSCCSNSCFGNRFFPNGLRKRIFLKSTVISQ